MHLGLMLDVSGSMDEDIGFTQDRGDQVPQHADRRRRHHGRGLRHRGARGALQPERVRAAHRADPPQEGQRHDRAVRRDRALPRRGQRPGRPEDHALYTDGGDTRSAIRFHELIDLLKASDVTIYPIGALEHQPSSSRNQQRMLLQQIADVTGGQAFFPTVVKELDGVYEKVIAADPRAVHARLPVHQRQDRRRVAEGRGQDGAQGWPRPARPLAEGLLRAVQEAVAEPSAPVPSPTLAPSPQPLVPW